MLGSRFIPSRPAGRALWLAAIGALIVACGQPAPPSPGNTAAPAPPAATDAGPTQIPVPSAQAGVVTPASGPSGVDGPFPDFGFLPAPGAYTGPVFKLSQDYPAEPPPAASLPPFMQMDFQKDWRNYMLAVRSYCFEGNTGVDWRVEDNTVRRWYHIPWQHYGPSGREGIHGLTKEAPVVPRQLAATQTYADGQTYAVGIFNEFGGYTIGRVWADHGNPDPGATTAPGGFLEGTVICKLLFVDVPTDQVPFLANPVQWDGYITDTYKSSTRSIRKLALIQMDIAIKERRAPTGWVFGTFQYNGALNKPDKWENLIPVGLMWGNDPEITDDEYTNPTPTETKINPNLKETVINPDTNELPPTHLGWNGRLNGPVDNPRSSCMSCHMTAEVPALSPITPFFQKDAPPVGSPEWMRWFQNVKCGTAFDEGAKSADFSLQLSIGITNFYTWKDTLDGLYASSYHPSGPTTRLFASPRAGTAKVPAVQGKTVHPIVRDMPASPPKR
jgi:hypothetical protein